MTQQLEQCPGLFEEIDKTKNEISHNLLLASSCYTRAGMGLMFGNQSGGNTQAAIGNLAIATELLLKAYIAQLDLSLLFNNIPAEMICALAVPQAMPESFRVSPYLIELKSGAYKSLELDEVISRFYFFYPNLKKQFGAHFKFLSKQRNICVHSVHPSYQEYEFERTAFLLLSLVKCIEMAKVDLIADYNWGDEAKNNYFLERFDEKRIKRVQGMVECAKKKAKDLAERVLLEPEEWDWYPIECPICGSSGKLWGETQEQVDCDEDGNGSIYLTSGLYEFQ